MQWDVRRLGEVDSTNRWALDMARQGAPEGLVAVADHQTAGRGRLGRRWEAPPGTCLLTSILLRPRHLPPARRHLVTAAVALAGADACAQVAGVAAELKWPNDLLVDDRKLAGVLAEGEGDAVVAGIGINVTWAYEGATCLAEHLPAGHAPVDREALLDALLAGVAGRYGRWDDVAAEYQARCATVGRDVRVDLGERRVIEGRAVAVTGDGHLVVDAAGEHHEVAAADVVHLRPT